MSFFMSINRRNIHLVGNLAENLGYSPCPDQQRQAKARQLRPQLGQAVTDKSPMTLRACRLLPIFRLDDEYRQNGKGSAGRMQQRCVIINTQITFEPDKGNLWHLFGISVT